MTEMQSALRYFCLENYKLLRMYVHILFNARLAQQGLEWSADKLRFRTRKGYDLKTSKVTELRILVGSIAQLTSLHYIDGRLDVEPEQVVNTALKAYFRFCDLSREQEEELFRELDEKVTEDVCRQHAAFMQEHMYDFVLFD